MPRPTFASYLELPITVQHSWDAFPVVDQALVQLEGGQFYEAALLADAVYTDDRVLACLTTRVNGLFGLPLEFKWPGQSKQHASVKPAGDDSATQAAPEQEGQDSPEALELKQRLARIVSENWERILPGASAREQMRWGILLNAGLGELVWDWGADHLLWPTMKTWNTQFLWWRYEPGGGSSYWLTTDSGPVRVTPGDGRWVLFAPTGHSHGWLYGLIRALGKLWLDRVFSMRDSSRASEKYSIGIIKGKHPSNASAADKLRFSASCANMPNEAFVMLPQGAKKEDQGFDIEMMETDPMVHPDFHEKRMHRLDTNIAVCLLGQNLSTEISGSGGSRAAAQVHDNVRGDYLKADDEIWSSMVRTQILTPWVRYNFGDIIEGMGRRVEEFVPEVNHKVDPPEDLEKKSKAIAMASTAIPNLQGTEADIHALLDEYGIPTIDTKQSPGQSPSGSDVNERPGGPGESGAAPVEAARRRGHAQKPGARKGQIRADELADAAHEAGAKALKAEKDALLDICLTAPDYATMRQQIERLYLGTKPEKLRRILEESVVAGHLIGRLGGHMDVSHG